MALSDELDAYQTYLEAVRLRPDDDELWEDLAKAKAAVEVAYLEWMVAGPTTPDAEDTHRRGTPRPPFDPEVGVTTDVEGGW